MSTHLLRPLLAGLLALPVGAQAPALARPEAGRMPFVVLGPDEGVPTTGPVAIAQDNDGFIWLGTEGGLIRYDRGQCRVYTDKDGLPSPFVSRLFPARGGGLWVEAQVGLVRFLDGRFEAPRFPGETPKAGSNLLTLDRQGRLWMLTDRGFYVQHEGLEFSHLPWPTFGKPLLLHAGGRSQWLFTASEDAVRAYLPDGTCRTWGAASGYTVSAPSLLAEDGDGRVWVGSGRKLLMKAPDSDRFTDQSRLLPGSLSPNSLPHLDPDGSLWVPTQNGALRITGARTERLDAAAGLPFRWVRALLRDREGSLWVLGPSLARLQGGGRLRNYALSGGPSGEAVWSILRDRDGSLLVGTDDGAARLESGEMKRIRGSEGHRIKCLARDPLGNLWMASSTGPTLWIPAGRHVAEVAPLGEAGLHTHAVMTDSKARVWVGHSSLGVLRLDPATRRLSQEVGPEIARTDHLAVFSFREDRDGRIWAGSSAGLLVRDLDAGWRLFTDRDGLYPRAVRDLVFLPDGSAWLHNQEPRGLTRVRLERGQLQVLEHRGQGQGLRSNMVYGVTLDGQGHLWVSTDLGLDRVDSPLHVGRHDGMASEDCNVHALLAEGSRIWVGTTMGLVRYDGSAIADSTSPPEARIVAASFGTQRKEPPFGTLAPFSHRDGTAEFRMTAPSYLNESELRFQVRLVGLEGEWRDLEGKRARYPALAGGTYRFETRVALGSGPFGPAAGLDFTVRPPWWRSLGFRILAALGGLAAVAGIIRIRLASLARAKVALEALVAQRTAELESRNRDLSEALTRVKQLSGLLPICSCCKKIRDDKGYWNQLENYISTHSEADFTHGICPDCVDTLFPEVGHRKSKPESDLPS
ncbi:MAG TPA: two-component regulator propeller domain-containing protein [Holophagaceae bacterium]|nr:two-component regulator propeller domain-containing protein [Holophagaceae bacterium]